ncbi:1-acyl-sn-glycerol-3-phosphate acyltransferase [Neptunicoccus cionae]|uniref:Glycerol-3-phosphate acyltransferase n=1 Tax=Neptunicoccus cionae TaxID=2035344 RepID=A0A916VRB4_9RHOB|nr:1-acyl-sn-glycerol-3-phosphate acyltransferase [Amylibacter cionae]GGA23741.1 glycerol-3-phosphate 1-O-acyltransferase [Amylibacter cionae]
MFETVEIQVWVVWVTGLLALAGLLDRILMPSVRWYLRRRFNRAIEQLNSKLQLQIQPFKLTQRQVMVDRLAHDPQVMEAVLEHSNEEGIPYHVAAKMAMGYAREIVPSFSAFAYFGFGIRFARWLSRTLYRVRLGYVDEGALQKMDPNATVVFVMNHRSNMDYVIVTFLAASRSALSYAVGEWARVWPLKQLIRSTGAYFIRRKSRNLLYRRVLSRYVQMATAAGVTQAVFPEGSLSRDGSLRPAKLGLLNYIVSDFDPDQERDVVFVPVGVNYDRVLEDRVLLAANRGEKTGLLFKLWTFVHFVVRHLWLRLTGRFYKFGYASVSFGVPLSLKAFLAEKEKVSHEKMTADLGKALMKQVGRVIPVLPVSLVSTVLLDQGETPLNAAEVQHLAEAELERLLANGAHMHIPRKRLDYAVEVGLRMLVLRRALVEKDGRFTLQPEQLEVVRYYANAIAHLR